MFVVNNQNTLKVEKLTLIFIYYIPTIELSSRYSSVFTYKYIILPRHNIKVAIYRYDTRNVMDYFNIP